MSSHVFAIVCDVCNAPMMRWVIDTGMARCDKCQAAHEIDLMHMELEDDANLSPAYCRYCFGVEMTCQDGGCECPRCGYTESM